MRARWNADAALRVLISTVDIASAALRAVKGLVLNGLSVTSSNAPLGEDRRVLQGGDAKTALDLSLLTLHAAYHGALHKSVRRQLAFWQHW